MGIELNGQNDIVRRNGNLPDEVVASKASPSLTADEIAYLDGLPTQSKLKQAYLASTAFSTLQSYQVQQVQNLVSDTNKGYVSTAHGLQIDYANASSINLVVWTGATGTVTLTREVMLEGRPTLRVDMPSACTRVEIGVSAGVVVPSSYDAFPGRTFGVAFNVPDYTPFGIMALYLGDSSYTTYDLLSVDLPAQQPWNGWHLMNWRDGAPGESAPGNKTLANAAAASQSKFRINKSAGVAGVIYLSWAGTMPKEESKVLWTADDGYLEWHTWLRGAATVRGIPFALGFDRFYAGAAGFMTENNIRSMAADTTGLFELYPHAYQNLGVTDIGAAQYLANDDACWAWLQSLGVRNNRVYHPFVKGQYNDTALAGMAARGVSLCRTVNPGNSAQGTTFKTSTATTFRNDAMLRLPIGLNLESTLTLAQAKTAVDLAESTGGTLVIMAHGFVASGPTGLQWTFADTEALMDYTATKERKGTLQNVKASQLAAATTKAP